jgi:signal transduction histidine kinase
MTANILIADDTPENLHLLFGMLTGENYRIRLVPSGLRALSAVQAEIPDLILLDIKMPDLDGYEVCERLKADERIRDIPVIFISALNGAFDKVKAFSAGGVDYITKPFQVEEVLARVETHLMLRNQQKHLEEKNTQLQQEITRRKQAEEELQGLNQQLQETNQQLQEAIASKDKFFSIIAHDLRDPFNSLFVLTEVIVEDIDHYSKDQIKVKLQNLHKTSEKVYALLNNLLTWSQLQRGVMTCEPQQFPLEEIAARNVRLFTTNAEQKQITLRNLVSKETLAYADYTMVDTIMRNLLSNALKFTDAGGTIEVTAQQDENIAEVAVTDTGIGMNQENIEKLFRIDVKCSRRGTNDEEGTGLGLILCKELVEKNDGKIGIESEVGKGTTFVFTLPTTRG